MDTTPTIMKQRTVRGAVALGAVALLVAGAAWRGSAAEPASTTSTTTAASARHTESVFFCSEIHATDST